MIFGVGIDLINLSRIKKAMERKNFLNLNFTQKELECYEKAGSPVEGIAARFAVKEAVFKALGTGWIDGREVEVLIAEGGKPIVRLGGKTKAKAKQLKIKKIEVSMSYYGDQAVALAVAEK